MTLTLVRGDTVPIRFKLERKNDAGAWFVPSFSGATPRLIIADDQGRVVFDRTGAFEDVATGVVQIPRLVGDLGGQGELDLCGECEVTFGDGSKQTFPNRPGKVHVRVLPELA